MAIQEGGQDKMRGERKRHKIHYQKGGNHYRDYESKKIKGGCETFMATFLTQ